MASITIPGMFLTGNHASRPSSGVGVGTLYACSTHGLIYQTTDTGSTWGTWATLGGATVDDATISTTDITTNNASTSKHGWLKKLDNNAAHFMDGTGAWSTPSGSGSVATDAIWDAAGDLAVGSGADTAAKLTLGASGTVPTAGASTLAYAYPPGYEFSYVEFTSPVSVTNTSDAAADTIVTSAAVTYSGTQRIKVEFYAPYTVTVSTQNLTCVIYDGSSAIGRIWQGQVSASGSDVLAPSGSRFLTPSNASHTYSIRSFTQSGTATIGAGAGGATAYMPGYIRITAA